MKCDDVIASLWSPLNRASHWGYIGLYWDDIGGILELYRDNGKENGNYYLGFRVEEFRV